jgi:hypothetical protein
VSKTIWEFSDDLSFSPSFLSYNFPLAFLPFLIASENIFGEAGLFLR